jgi:hypothetical protein
MKPNLEDVMQVVQEAFSRDLRSIERTMDLNYLRQAFVNVLRPYYTTTQLGEVLKRNHSTMVHYGKSHLTLMRDNYYRDCFHRIQAIYNECMNEELTIRPLHALKAELTELKSRMSELEIQIQKHDNKELQSDMV